MTDHQDRDGDTRVVDGELHVFRAGRGWIALGWSAYTLGTRTWLTPAASVEALNVPWQVGARAVANLHDSHITLPAINIPGPPNRWALLMQPYDGPKGDILNAFADQDVGYAYIGRHGGQLSEWGIDLPPTSHPGHDPLTWISLPDNPLPPADVVVRAVAEALTSRRGQ